LHGQTQYGPRIPRLITKIFDVTMPIAAQGIAADHYDIVIAANVLHATPNIRESVRNAKATLRKNGTRGKSRTLVTESVLHAASGS
jgi:hypothetical protein